LSGGVAKLASIILWKLVLSPTGSINLGFILREDLLMCSSYLPFGVPNWAVIYTPSACRLGLFVNLKDEDSDEASATAKAAAAGRPRPSRHLVMMTTMPTKTSSVIF
jgi:hypothetical protein